MNYFRTCLLFNFLATICSLTIKCKNGLVCIETIFQADECALIELDFDQNCICSIPDTCNRIPIYLTNNCNKFECIGISNSTTLSPPHNSTVPSPKEISSGKALSALILIGSVVGNVIIVILNYSRLKTLFLSCLVLLKPFFENLLKCLAWPFIVIAKWLWSKIDPIGLVIENKICDWWENRGQTEENEDERPIVKLVTQLFIK